MKKRHDLFLMINPEKLKKVERRMYIESIRTGRPESITVQSVLQYVIECIDIWDGNKP